MHDLSICEQMAVFSQHDVFVMPHGAALFGVLWAPALSLVVEVFPAVGVDWSWLQMLVRGMRLTWVRMNGDERVSAPHLALRPGGQDDPFKVRVESVVRMLEEQGMDMSEAWRILRGENATSTTAAGTLG